MPETVCFEVAFKQRIEDVVLFILTKREGFQFLN